MASGRCPGPPSRVPATRYGCAAAVSPADLRVDRTIARCGPGRDGARRAGPCGWRRRPQRGPRPAAGGRRAGELGPRTWRGDRRPDQRRLRRRWRGRGRRGRRRRRRRLRRRGQGLGTAGARRAGRAVAERPRHAPGGAVVPPTWSAPGQLGERADTVLVPGGTAATYPIETVPASTSRRQRHSLVDDCPRRRRPPLGRRGRRRLAGRAGRQPDRPGRRPPVATLPGSETIDGTVFSPRLGPDNDVGWPTPGPSCARSTPTWPTGTRRGARGRGRGAGRPRDEVGRPPPLFDWGSGTTTRVQEAFLRTGAVAFEQPLAEDRLATAARRRVVGEGA